MKNKLNIIFLSVVLVGCGPTNPMYFSDAEFLIYKIRFIEEASLRGIDIEFDLPISFVDEFNKPYEHSTGICYYVSKHIKILKDTWEFLDENQRELLIFHELGHCLLNRIKHDNTLVDDKMRSIMHHHVVDMDNGHYRNNRTELLDELFEGGIR